MNTRRRFLKISSSAALASATGAGADLAVAMSQTATSTAVDRQFDLTPKAGEKNIVGPEFPATQVWGFNAQVPGSAIRIRHGEQLTANVTNGLEVPTSVHWHGIRLPNEMDGVPGLTQSAIKPGESFQYRFTPPDAGTFWYHSHVNAYEQVGRGLYGPLIIEEQSPPQVDRDLVWMIDDWRLMDDASIREDFASGHDRSHAGRIGNVPTVNGRFRDVVNVQAGERIRLRLVNASNARNFALTFNDLEPLVIAVDGQPVKPRVTTEPVVIGAAGRVDLILDMTGKPGSSSTVRDSFYRNSFDLTRFVYTETALRESPLDEVIELSPSQLPVPDIDNAVHHDIVMGGGAMSGLHRAKLDGKWADLRDIARQGYVWALNDTVGNRVDMPPLFSVARGTSVRLTLRNNTSFPHPMHLHGHHMKLLKVDDQNLDEPRWVDSPLLMPQQTMDLAFVADNPGRWLFHCHILEHHASGLGSLIEVT